MLFERSIYNYYRNESKSFSNYDVDIIEIKNIA